MGVVCVVVRVVWWFLVGVGLLVGVLGRVLAWLGRVAVFVAEPLDELVTAWMGVAPVLRRWRRWRWRAAREWRCYQDRRTGRVVEADVVRGGVWR